MPNKPKQYKWSHPSEWLDDYIDTIGSLSEMRDLALDVARQLDGDQIEDLFQAEMEADGYFTPMKRDVRSRS